MLPGVTFQANKLSHRLHRSLYERFPIDSHISFILTSHVFWIFDEPESASSLVTRTQVLLRHGEYGGGLPDTANMY